MVVRRLVTTDNMEGSTQLDLLAMKNSPVAGSGFLNSYMSAVLGYRGMVNLLCPASEFTHETADSILAKGYIKLTNKYRVGNSKRCFYMVLKDGVEGGFDVGTATLKEFLKDLASSDPDLSPDEGSLLNDIVRRLQNMYGHDDKQIGHYILQAYSDVLKIDNTNLSLEDVVGMLRYLSMEPPAHDWDSYSSEFAEANILEYCVQMRGKVSVHFSGLESIDMKVDKLRYALSDGTTPVRSNPRSDGPVKSKYVGDLENLVEIYQVLTVYSIVPREHTWMPYEDTCIVIAESFFGSQIVEFYCDAKLGCKQYHYGDVLRITYNEVPEGSMIQDMRRIHIEKPKEYLDGDIQIKGEVLSIGYKDESDVIRKVSVKLSTPLIIRSEVLPEDQFSINWLEENAGPLPEVGQKVEVWGKRSLGSYECYTAGPIVGSSEFNDTIAELEQL